MTPHRFVVRSLAVATTLSFALAGCSDETPTPPAPHTQAPAAISSAPPTVATVKPQDAVPQDKMGWGRKAASHAHWAYEGETGPTTWGTLAEGFASCSKGSNQSPIDISFVAITDLPAIGLSYQDSPLQVENNGHTIQVKYQSGSTLTLGGTRYELVQFHFHSPSEHTLGGHAFDMGVHFVHKSAEGKLAVIAAMLKAGEENGLVKTIWENAPSEVGHTNAQQVSINASALLPQNMTRYFQYAGSLTTPPCSEGVNWIVLAQPVEVSSTQIAKFREWFPLSARPVQPVNGRAVLATN